jgi:metallopeptidase family M12-like protein
MPVKQFLLACALTSAACAPLSLDATFARINASQHSSHEGYVVYVDPAFPPKVIDIIKQSMADWQTNLRSLVVFDVRLERSDCKEEDHTICIEPAAPSQLGDAVAGTTSRFSGYNGALVRISTANWAPEVANWRECTWATSAHELGHAMGLEHDHAGTIMARKGSARPMHITADDVRAFIADRRL